MSTEYAILVSLAEQPATGYDLTRRFDRSVGFFWSASHQQIYRTLARMEAAGHVSVRTAPGEGGPERKVFRLTESGRCRLEEWTRTPTEPEQVRSELALKVRGMRHGDVAAVTDDIRRQRDHHAERLAYYEANAAKNYPDPSAVPPAELGAYLVLRGGIRTERAYVEWCDEMLAALDGTTELALNAPATQEIP